MGKTMDNIVVDTIKTAHECIQFLKEQHLQAETFLALDYIEPGHLDERLREIREPRNTKMLIDVIKFNPPQIKKAVLSAVGNTLVCESDEDARKLAFGAQRHKVVSFDGTLFQKSGLISGGSSELRQKAKRWDEKHVDALRKRKEDLSEQLKEQLKIRRREPDLNDLRANIKGLEYRVKYSRQNKDIEEKKIAELEKELAAIRNEEGNDGKAKEIEKRMQERAQRLKKAKQESNQIDDEIYKDFCKSIGVENIRVYEERELAGQEELVKRRMAIQEKKMRLTTQLDFEKSRDTQS
jgi:structural maintenance of chromosome 1